MTFDDLQKSIKKGNLKDIETALDGGLDPNLCNKNGYTLLMLAAKTGNTAIGKLLIEHGADLNVCTTFPRSSFQSSPLAVAAMSGKPSFVCLLLEKGASLDASPHSGSFESYIEWLEKHTAVSTEQADNIRSVIRVEREKRVA